MNLVFCQSPVNQQLIDEFKKVSGKTGLLFRIAEVAIAEPNGIIEQVIFPVVSRQTLKNLVAEYKATSTAYRRRVHNVVRTSFAGHYRRMIPQLLEFVIDERDQIYFAQALA